MKKSSKIKLLNRGWGVLRLWGKATRRIIMKAAMRVEMEQHLRETLLPFWKNLKDDIYGGFYGFMGTDLDVDKKAEKGCILNSRILWFFSNTYRQVKTLYRLHRHA